MVLTIKDFINAAGGAGKSPHRHHGKKSGAAEDKEKQLLHPHQKSAAHAPIVETLTTVTTRTATETTRNTSRSPRGLARVGNSHSHSPTSIQTSVPTSTIHSRSSNGSSNNSSTFSILLHELIAGRQFEQALERLYMAPEEASMNNGNGGGNEDATPHHTSNLALHEACKHQAPLELVEKLLEIHPDAVQQPGQWGYLPLHFAVCSRASSDVVAKLISTYPSATRNNSNSEGKLPLHLACKWGASETVVLMLTTVHPNAVLKEDASGKTPLEHAQFVASTSPSGSDMSESAMKSIQILQDIAPLLHTVTKAAMHKLRVESEAKFLAVVENYKERMTAVKQLYDDDKLQAEQLETKLRNELQSSRQEKKALLQQVEELQSALAASKQQQDKGIHHLQKQVSKLLSKLHQKDEELTQSKTLMHQIQGMLQAGDENKKLPGILDESKVTPSRSTKSQTSETQLSTPKISHHHRHGRNQVTDAKEKDLAYDARDDYEPKHHREHQKQVNREDRLEKCRHGASPQEVIHTAFTPNRSHKNKSTKKSRSSTESKSKKDDKVASSTVEPRYCDPGLDLDFQREDSNEEREGHLAETIEKRDPPPSSPPSSPRPDYQYTLDDFEHDVKQRKMSEKDKTRAVASVRDWSSEAEALSQAEDDLLSRLLASEKSTLSTKQKDTRKKSPRKAKSDEKYDIPTDIASRGHAIRHGYSNKTKDYVPSRPEEGRTKDKKEYYHHYQQEYELLLSRSKSNLRRRMESSNACGGEDVHIKNDKTSGIAVGKDANRSDKKSSPKQKSSRHGSPKKRSTQKPMEVIVDTRKATGKGIERSSGSGNRNSPQGQIQHYQDQRDDDEQDYRRSGTPNRRQPAKKEERLDRYARHWDEDDDDHDEDSTLVSAMNE